MTVGFALGRAASLVLRVKQHARTLEIVRARGREGRSSLKWDGMLGSRAARKGTYRLDLYAVAADGRRARASDRTDRQVALESYPRHVRFAAFSALQCGIRDNRQGRRVR